MKNIYFFIFSLAIVGAGPDLRLKLTQWILPFIKKGNFDVVENYDLNLLNSQHGIYRNIQTRNMTLV